MLFPYSTRSYRSLAPIPVFSGLTRSCFIIQCLENLSFSWHGASLQNLYSFGCMQSWKWWDMHDSVERGPRAHFHRPSLVHCGHFRSWMPRMCLIYWVCVRLGLLWHLAIIQWQRCLLPPLLFYHLLCSSQLWAHLYIQSISGRGKK